MDRRPLITVTATAVTVGFAGCLTAIDDIVSSEPATSSGMAVRTYSDVADVLEDGLGYYQTAGEYEWGRNDHYWAVIDRTETAEKRFVDDEPVDEFVYDTDFENEYLLVVQYGMQSERELVPVEFESTDDGLHAEFSIETPSVGGDDYAVHSVIVRIDDERSEDGTPETDEVTITIDGDEYPAPDT